MVATENASLHARHDHDMSMGAMSVGTINVLWFPRLYWIFVGSAISGFTLVNLINQYLYRQRLSAANSGRVSPAKPKSLLWRGYATLTALARESCNFSFGSLRRSSLYIVQPTMGSLFLILSYIALILTLCFYDLDTTDLLEFENIGYRCGFVSIAQIPLIFLLSGKNNIIGFLTGSSYERLNHLHRWTARVFLLSTTIHMSYWFSSWAPYDFIGYQLSHDATARRGLASWSILVWIVLSSFAPIRKWSYEVFVIQHTISYIALITMIFLHTPSHIHGWLWAPVAIYFFDRVTRAIYSAYINLSVFHPKKNSSGDMFTCHAELTSCPNQTTRFTIRDPPITWKPGQHAFLSCHSIVPLQSHPFTISSLYEDGKLEFFVKAHTGGTRRFLDYAEKRLALPTSQMSNTKSTIPVIIDGPYGRMRPLRQFDSVILFAGSTGATFTVPHLRDIVRLWKLRARQGTAQRRLSRFFAPEYAVTRRIRFIWVVKSRSQTSLFERELNHVAADVEQLRQQGQDVSVDLSVYVTCDDTLTSEWTNTTIDSLVKPSNPGGKLEISDSSSGESVYSDAKDSLEKADKHATGQVSEKEIDPRLESTEFQLPHSRKLKTCGPDGTCCCKLPALASDDEIANVVCTCHEQDAKADFEIATNELTPSSTVVSPSINTYTGRPDLRSITRKALERADGESAVVSCGPRSMNEECRRMVVALSDERAVHKGTGAQGVWFWGEGYGYA